MGFSSDSGSNQGSVDAANAAPNTNGDGHASFGHMLIDYLKNRYPIAGGVAGAIAGNGRPTQDGSSGAVAQAGQAASAPPVVLPSNNMPDYSGLISQNAQPSQGSGQGLKAILSMLAA